MRRVASKAILGREDSPPLPLTLGARERGGARGLTVAAVDREGSLRRGLGAVHSCRKGSGEVFGSGRSDCGGCGSWNGILEDIRDGSRRLWESGEAAVVLLDASTGRGHSANGISAMGVEDWQGGVGLRGN